MFDKIKDLGGSMKNAVLKKLLENEKVRVQVSDLIEKHIKKCLENSAGIRVCCYGDYKAYSLNKNGVPSSFDANSLLKIDGVPKDLLSISTIVKMFGGENSGAKKYLDFYTENGILIFSVYEGENLVICDKVGNVIKEGIESFLTQNAES